VRLFRIYCYALAAVVPFLSFHAKLDAQQIIPAGQLFIDGRQASCGANVTILGPNLNDIGKNDLQGHIYINPVILGQLPTVGKLFFYAHECGHSVVGLNEQLADAWAIKTGKCQGWFPPAAFEVLIAVFRGNMGDWTHKPGEQRVADMIAFYPVASCP
jgi:hypothetical protein